MFLSISQTRSLIKQNDQRGAGTKQTVLDVRDLGRPGLPLRLLACALLTKCSLAWLT